MRTSAIALSALVCLSSVASAAPISSRIRPLIPRGIEIDSPAAADGRRELQELVTSCGEGVVRGVRAANKCSFQIALDTLFFTPLKKKTGLLPDSDWAYRDGVTWFEPNVSRDLPEKFDLRDLMKNGQPVIKTQKCGDCWAWATHHGLEISRAVHDQKVYDHSIQTVLSCSKKGSCSGGTMEAVGFLLHGLPMEEDFPYTGNNARCKFSAGEISTGWDAKVADAPYIGSSREYSLARQFDDGSYATDGNKVTKMMAAIKEWESPLVVTVDAFSISGGGVYNKCGAINSGGNHMVTIVGWDNEGGKRNAHVWNSWGPSHGDKGVSRIVWECGSGKLNRGLGQAARIVQYKPPCTPPNAAQTYMHEIQAGKSTQVGAAQAADTTCTWAPTDGLSDPHACVTTASPGGTTEYHLTAQNACGKSTSIALVDVWPARGERPSPRIVRTPDGDIEVY